MRTPAETSSKTCSSGAAATPPERLPGYLAGVPDKEPSARLSPEEIEVVTARLASGEYLDDYYRQLLFRQPKEYALSYAAKDPRSRVLAETMGVPLQVLKRFGDPGSDWTNKLVFGDNLQVLKTLVEMKKRGELRNADGSHGIRVCYIDPPFASKQEFRGARGARAYRDKVAGAAFVEFLRKRLIFIQELLAEDGALYVHLDTRKSHYIKVVLDEIFGENNFRSEIIWKRTTAHSGANRYGPVHDVILFYSKSPQYIWNQSHQAYDPAYIADKYRYSSDDKRLYRLSDLTAAGVRRGETGQPWRGIDVTSRGRHWSVPPKELDKLDANRRIYWPPKEGGVPGFKRYLDEMPGVPLQDVWSDIDAVNPMALERAGFPTQKPQALLERVIKASSNEGDLVLDCFSGSGTSAVVAQRLGRRWIAVDCGKLAVYVAQRRLLATNGGNAQAPTMQPTSFELCSAGLYENDRLEELSFDGFKTFCLELFDCRDQPHTISNITMAGTRKGEPVHFFPFQDTETEMGMAYIESLARRLKGKVSGAVYVVAPVSACDPGLFEDVVTLDKLTFFILRVPYSVIEALHGRRFQPLDQPFSELLVNDPMETFGFDFVQIPEADTRYVRNGGQLHGVLRSFMHGGMDPDDFASAEEAGRLDLAMVMVDRDYDGEVFRVSDYFFGDELELNGWRFALPLQDVGQRLHIIYMDTHGNERRETIEVAEVKQGAKPRAASSKPVAKKPSEAAA